MSTFLEAVNGIGIIWLFILALDSASSLRSIAKSLESAEDRRKACQERKRVVL